MSVVFDQLRVSDDGNTLFINAHVIGTEAFENVYIDNVTIKTPDGVSEIAPEMSGDNYIYKKTYTENVKEVSLAITKASITEAFINTDSSGNPIDSSKPIGKEDFKDANFSNNLFFVFIECRHNGAPNECYECLSCEEASLINEGVTFDEATYYQKAMDYTRELAADCTIPQGFTDFILLWNAFKAAVETEHYTPAVHFYNLMFNKGFGNTTYGITKGCGCHG